MPSAFQTCSTLRGKSCEVNRKNVYYSLSSCGFEQDSIGALNMDGFLILYLKTEPGCAGRGEGGSRKSECALPFYERDGQLWCSTFKIIESISISTATFG